MTPHFVLQASGALYKMTSEWTFVFGVFVTDQDGTPVEGLKKGNFSIWGLATFDGQLKISGINALNAQYPEAKMPGVYRLQAVKLGSSESPRPLEFVFAIRASRVNKSKKGRTITQGMTTCGDL